MISFTSRISQSPLLKGEVMVRGSSQKEESAVGGWPDHLKTVHPGRHRLRAVAVRSLAYVVTNRIQRLYRV